MAIKKSELYGTLWESCNALRGSMDASQYKDYVLIILFVKYLSDKASQNKSYIKIPKDCTFADFVLLKQDPHIGEKINIKLEAIRDANAVFLGSLSLPNFNDENKLGRGKDMVKTLSGLIAAFENKALDFSQNRAADDDLLGDAYEYLMKNFAAESGKSKGQFYTPAEVSRIMAKVLDLHEFERAGDTIYDPTCGSGSLLLRALSETANQKATLYGQEKDGVTASLAKLNMLLHGIVNAKIEVGDTLNAPKFKTTSSLETFDVCVANPPFSVKDWLGDAGASDLYDRWCPKLLPPAKNGDYAFLLHLIRSMRDDPGHEGRGACILPHGVLFRGNSEADIRRDLIERHIIKGIIGLPANLFFGTGIPASILIIDKRNRATRRGIFFIDAKDGFMKDGPKNRLREQDIRRIVDVWEAQEEIPHYSHFAPWEEIAQNDYNLNIPRYVAPRDTSITHNLDGHLRGGISNDEINGFETLWAAFPPAKEALFKKCRAGFSALAVPPEEIAPTFLNSPEATAIKGRLMKAFGQWSTSTRDYLLGHINDNPKTTIETLALEIRDDFSSVSPLIDRYDVYGAFMDYVASTLRDDLYILNADGWLVGREIVITKQTKRDLVWDGALIPKAFVSRRFFPELATAAEKAQHAFERAQAALDQFLADEADKGEDSEIVEPNEDADATPKAYKDAELKKKRDLPEVAKYFDLKDEIKDAKKAAQSAAEKLDKATQKQFAALTEAEIQVLLFEDKWFATLSASIAALFETMIRGYSSSLTDLAARYEHTLPELEAKLAQSQNAVHEVLHSLGFNW